MTSIDIVNQFYADATKKLKALNDAKADLIPIQLQIAEYERQRAVHQGSGAINDYNIVSQWMQPWVDKRNNQNNLIATLQAAYDEAEELYQQKQNELLSESQKQALNEQNAALAAAQAAKSAAEKEKISAQSAAQKSIEDAKNFAQKNTQYLIYGAIALVVLTIGIFIYRKNFAA